MPPHDRPVTILLCEDEEAILRSMQRILAAAGYSVLAASSAEQAIEIAALHAEPIDVLLTDVGLDGRSGAELAQEIRSAHPRIAVLYASGSEAAELEVADDGPWSFLEKPFKPDSLLRSVAAVLQRPRR